MVNPTRPLDNDVDKSSSIPGKGKLLNVPAHLCIGIKFVDEFIVVVDKPNNLRSVPGHANELTTKPASKQTHNEDPSIGKQRRTGQQAWVAAIRTFADYAQHDNVVISHCLRNLATTVQTNEAIPRKWKPFLRYCRRNKRSLLKMKHELEEDEYREIYDKIVERQRPLLNLPEPTRHEQSVVGQLILLGYGHFNSSKSSSEASTSRQLFVVHRLDCETSGIMVLARDESSASILSRAWRERDNVKKEYLARVRDWPPYHQKNQRAGQIDEPLAPSDERLKWEVQQDGRPSLTLWKVIPEPEMDDADETRTKATVTLSLTPVTGRTHQLRIHCAHVGSGIEGDSLYGTDPVKWDHQSGNNRLLLHAYKLSFPHPTTGERMEFVSHPSWLSSREDMVVATLNPI